MLTDVMREDHGLILDQVSDRLERLSGTRILITGAGGFLCSYFVDVIAAAVDRLKEPCRIVAVDNYITGVADRFDYLKGSESLRVLQHDLVQPLTLDEPMDWIIHGASIASPPVYRKYPLETIDVNVQGTRHLLEAARQDVRGMLYLSTSEVYGDPDPEQVPTSESYLGRVSCTGPRACYDESKRLAETLCSIYARIYGVPVKIIRPFNVFGPGQRLDDGRILPDLLSAALQGGRFEMHSDGTATRSFCYIADAIIAMLHVLLGEAQEGVYNVGNDSEEIQIGDLAQRVQLIVGEDWLEIVHRVSADPDYLTDNPQRRCPDLSRIRSEFGWAPTVDLDEAISRTLAYYRQAGEGTPA